MAFFAKKSAKLTKKIKKGIDLHRKKMCNVSNLNKIETEHF